MSKEKSNTDKTEYLVHFKKWEWLIFITLILLIVSSPYLFTRNSWFGVSFNDTGEIGDTIGGLTAPFVNLFAAFLVYKSFSAQISANFIQQKNHREQLVAQQENHNEQISILLNEQSRNLLLSIYDRVQEDYEKGRMSIVRMDGPDSSIMVFINYQNIHRRSLTNFLIGKDF